MTAANFILVDTNQYHLFSIGSSAYPSELGELMKSCLPLLAGKPKAGTGSPSEDYPLQGCEFMLRVDASYLYLIDTATKRVRGWHPDGGAGWQQDTLLCLLTQTKQEVDLSEVAGQLPPGWKILPPTDKQFNQCPYSLLREMAKVWDRTWDMINKPSGGFGAEAMAFRLPITPLDMPYNQPEYYNQQRVVQMSRDGVWTVRRAVQSKPGSWQNLNCIGYEQVGRGQTKRLFMAWRKAA